MMDWKGIISNKWFWIATIVIVVLLMTYYFGRASKKVPAAVPYKADQPAIPQGWTAEPSARALKNAAAGWGTDTQMIWDTLGYLNDNQLIAVYNGYNALYHPGGDGNLLSDFLDPNWLGIAELSGEDAQRFAQYFDGLV